VIGDHVVESHRCAGWLIGGTSDVDADVQEKLFDIEITLGMAAAGRVGVGELVESLARSADAVNDGIEVHFFEPLPPCI
jgi:hypothetical protein